MYVTSNQNQLTRKERFKLIRNLCILIAFDLLSLSLFTWLMVQYGRINLLSILSSVLVTLLILLISFYATKYFRDLKNGVVEIYEGILRDKYTEDAGDGDTGSQYLVINNRDFQVRFRNYHRAKINDHIRIRQAPISRYVLSVKIIKKSNENEN